MTEVQGRCWQSRFVGHDRGVALLAALLVAALLAAVGAGVVLVSNTERAVAGNFEAAHAMRLAADGALERALVEVRRLGASSLLDGSVSASFTDGTSRPVAPWGVTLDLAALTVELQTSTDSALPRSADAPVWRLLAYGGFSRLIQSTDRVTGQLYLVTWIGDDMGDGDGNPRADSNGIVVLVATALGPFGRRHTIRATVAVGQELRLLSWVVVG